VGFGPPASASSSSAVSESSQLNDRRFVVVPARAKIASVTLDGRSTGAHWRHTARGDELVVDAHSAGRHTLVVTLR
jgi:hypothetical protein